MTCATVALVISKSKMTCATVALSICKMKMTSATRKVVVRDT
jgi:hypothetical protein